MTLNTYAFDYGNEDLISRIVSLRLHILQSPITDLVAVRFFSALSYNSFFLSLPLSFSLSFFLSDRRSLGLEITTFFYITIKAVR